MTNSKLNKKGKELAKALGFTQIEKNIKVRSTEIDELAGYVILMANHLSAKFDANNETENSEKVINLLKLFLVKINFVSTCQYSIAA